MLKAKYLWWLVIWILVSCGPDTIFLRPGLDTPSQHLSNGYTLLGQKKFNDAGREFQRALELDPRFADAYVGLGLTYGRCGDLEKGFEALKEARSLARDDREWEKVQNAYEELHRIKNSTGAPTQK